MCTSHSATLFFLFNYPVSSMFYTLSLHDALPICVQGSVDLLVQRAEIADWQCWIGVAKDRPNRSKGRLGRSFATPIQRSEEHTSELQSPDHLVCRLLLEKKKKK